MTTAVNGVLCECPGVTKSRTEPCDEHGRNEQHRRWTRLNSHVKRSECGVKFNQSFKHYLLSANYYYYSMRDLAMTMNKKNNIIVIRRVITSIIIRI